MSDYLGKGLGGLFGGMISGYLTEKDKQDTQNELSKLYKNSITKLNEYLSPQPITQQQPGMENFGEYGELPLGKTESVTTQPKPDYTKGLQYLYEILPQFAKYGDEGAQYGNLLSSYYKTSQPEKQKSEIREVNGQLVEIKDGVPKVIYGEPKPEKEKKRTFGDYVAMTYEDVVKLPTPEIEDNFLYFSDAVKTKLRETEGFEWLNDKLKKEDIFSPKGSKGFKKTEFHPKFGVSDDISSFVALDNFNEMIRGGNELTDEQKQQYNAARLNLGKKYNLNDTELAQVIDQLDQTTTSEERQEVLESLSKGDFYNDIGTNQDQMDWDRGRIKEWQDYLDQIYRETPESYDGYKQSFLQELADFYSRGSITKKEYDDLRKSYF